MQHLNHTQQADLARVERGVKADHPDWDEDAATSETVARLVLLAQEGVLWAAELVIFTLGHAITGGAGPDAQATARDLFAKRI